MNKSILIINTPNTCEECDCSATFRGKLHCVIRGTEIYKGERDCSCPLVAVPEKLDIKAAKTMTNLRFVEGWNACIDKILGGSSGK